MNKIKKLIKKQGFTLVELIIVIAIIAVLAVAAFMMLTKWLGKSRDSRRLGDLGTIARGLQVGYSDTDDGINMYPDILHQDDKIALLSGAETVGYQGRVDSEVVKGASMQKVPLDPSDNNEYTYVVTQNRQKFQVLGMLEDGTEVGVLNDVFALEYTNRYPTTKGFELGVLLQKDTNLPIQYAGVSFTGIDLTSEGERDNYKAIVNNEDVRTGTGVAEVPIVKEDIIVIQDNGEETSESGQTQSEDVLLLHMDENYSSLEPDDNFVGNSLNTVKWNNDGFYGTVNNQLDMVSGQNQYSKLRTKYMVGGDFEIDVDYSDYVPRGTNYFCALRFMSAHVNNFEIYRNNNGYLGRVMNNGVFTVADNQDIISSGYLNTGKFKLKRSGNMGYVYVWNGSDRTLVKSHTTGQEPGVVWLRLNTDSTTQTSVTFSNFKVISGTLYTLGTTEDSAKNHTVNMIGANYNSNPSNIKSGNSSMYFDGQGDYLEVSDSEDWNFGSGDWTIDFWAYPTDLSATHSPMFAGGTVQGNFNVKIYAKHGTVGGGYIFAGIQDTSKNTSYITTTTLAPTDGFHHYVMKRTGEDIKLYLDDVEIGNISGYTASLDDSGVGLKIGEDSWSNYFKGYIDEIKITKGN